MSKHQSCFICRRDFVGPDDCIGNLCPECDADVHGDCHQSIRALEVRVEKLETALKRISGNEVERVHPTEGEFESDARYHYPAREQWFTDIARVALSDPAEGDKT